MQITGKNIWGNSVVILSIVSNVYQVITNTSYAILLIWCISVLKIPIVFTNPRHFLYIINFSAFSVDTQVWSNTLNAAPRIKATVKQSAPSRLKKCGWLCLLRLCLSLKIRTLWWAFRSSLHVYFTDWTKRSVSRMSGCSHCMITCVKPINFVHPYDLEADGPALRTTELSSDAEGRYQSVLRYEKWRGNVLLDLLWSTGLAEWLFVFHDASKPRGRVIPTSKPWGDSMILCHLIWNYDLHWLFDTCDIL